MQITKIFAFMIGLPLALMASPSYGEKILNDSLVKNLRCDSLSVSAIYESIREDAFAEGRHMPVKNWGFQSKMGELGACWGLSSAQRMMFYLGRYYSQNPDDSQKLESVLDQVRGRRLVATQLRGQHYPLGATFAEYPLLTQKVFHLQAGSLDATKHEVNGFWQSLQKGYLQDLAWGGEQRTFRGDIQAYQERAFFRFSNISMGMGNGPLSESENEKTVTQLIQNLDQKKLTMVNLRADQYAQHIVLFKSYKLLPDGVVEFKVYDSNQPAKDQIVYFESRRMQFYSPDVVKIIFKARANYALGAFIVDEDERDGLEKALLSYYKERCR